MVLQAEVYPSPGFPQHNYVQESSYKDAYYGSNSSMQMRPNPSFSSPNGPNHGMNGYGGYGNNGWNKPSHHYGGQGQSMYPQHGTMTNGYGNGYGTQMSNGYGNGYGYGTQQGSHMPMGSSTNRMEEMRYDYQGSSGGPYYGQQRNQNTWASKDLDD